MKIDQQSLLEACDDGEFEKARQYIEERKISLDFVDDEIASEFVFNNPKATGTCGCGSSFSV